MDHQQPGVISQPSSLAIPATVSRTLAKRDRVKLSCSRMTLARKVNSPEVELRTVLLVTEVKARDWANVYCASSQSGHT